VASGRQAEDKQQPKPLHAPDAACHKQHIYTCIGIAVLLEDNHARRQ
jgi:hypothetical protein